MRNRQKVDLQVRALGRDTNQNERYCRYPSTFTDEVVQLAFVVGDTWGHLFLELIHGDYLHSQVDHIADEEG